MNVAGVGAYQTKTFILPDGEPGTSKTIAALQQLVREGIRDPRIRRAATEILHANQVSAHHELAEVWAIYQWVLANIRFTKDMVDREMLQPAADILITRAGDCDCINAILLPALLGAIGYGTRAVTIKGNPTDPDSFSHIFIKVYLPASGEWIPLDAARPGAGWGVTAEVFWDVKEWPLTEGARALGNLPRFGLGQFEWSNLFESLPKIESGAAQVVGAARAPTYYPATAYGPAPGTFSVGGGVTGGGVPMGWIVAGLGVVALIFVMGRR